MGPKDGEHRTQTGTQERGQQSAEKCGTYRYMKVLGEAKQEEEDEEEEEED